MNYHLMIDDKFINDFIIDGEKTAPGNNIYIIDWPQEKVKHVKSDKAIFAPYGTELFLETVKNISEGDKVFIHWASDAAINFVLKLPENIKIGLFFWGGDIVEIPYSMFKKTIYGAQSLNYFEKHEERPKVKWNLLKIKRFYKTLANRYWKYKANDQKVWEIRKAFFGRLNYFLSWNIIDHQWILEHYTTQASYTYFFYNFNPSEGSNITSKPSQEDRPISLLLGNSDTVTNNHLEMLDDLERFKGENIKLIIPLNYGNKKYGDLIEQKAVRMFGEDKVVCLRHFMNREAYYRILDEVDVAIMNHYRTQAAGNTLALLYRGKKVFINEKSSTYKFLKINDVFIGNSAKISQLSFNEFIHPLSDDIRKKNVENINELFKVSVKEDVLSNLLK
ncbi:TDP-N-acetylfucosamine:lipid II N-acetylfucosaminyltransferase [Pedobacter panaciterrae]|uniref:TDP-N-acetylfucosamine:lipid II N-acetylfucosaminyltransferase n=2 Tax=Pedobacter panaciterrae TaxID=363849 RepID=A0ABU8NWV8_9SPHI